MARNKNEIQFFGLQRSGNHGIITWLLQQFESPQYFLNNVAHFEDPFSHYRHSVVPNMVPLSRDKIEQHRLVSKELLLFSYENLELKRLENEALVANKDSALGISERSSQVIIIREYYNWIVSRLKLYEVVGQRVDKSASISMLTDLWLSYAQEFCGRSNYLTENRVCILFDRWVVDEHYRKSILDELQIDLRDNSNGKVPVGGGSSFNEDQGRTKVSSQGVLNRWHKADIESEVRAMIEANVASRPNFQELYDYVMESNWQPDMNHQVA